MSVDVQTTPANAAPAAEDRYPYPTMSQATAMLPVVIAEVPKLTTGSADKAALGKAAHVFAGFGLAQAVGEYPPVAGASALVTPCDLPCESAPVVTVDDVVDLAKSLQSPTCAAAADGEPVQAAPDWVRLALMVLRLIRGK